MFESSFELTGTRISQLHLDSDSKDEMASVSNHSNSHTGNQKQVKKSIKNISKLLRNLEKSNKPVSDIDDPNIIQEYVSELMAKFSENQYGLTRDLGSIVESYKYNQFDPEHLEAMIEVEQTRSKHVLQLASFLDGQVNKLYGLFDTIFERVDKGKSLPEGMKDTVGTRLNVAQQSIDSMSKILCSSARDLDDAITEAENSVSEADNDAKAREMQMQVSLQHLLAIDKAREDVTSNLKPTAPEAELVTAPIIPPHSIHNESNQIRNAAARRYANEIKTGVIEEVMREDHRIHRMQDPKSQCVDAQCQTDSEHISSPCNDGYVWSDIDADADDDSIDETTHEKAPSTADSSDFRDLHAASTPPTSTLPVAPPMDTATHLIPNKRESKGATTDSIFASTHPVLGDISVHEIEVILDLRKGGSEGATPFKTMRKSSRMKAVKSVEAAPDKVDLPATISNKSDRSRDNMEKMQKKGSYKKSNERESKIEAFTVVKNSEVKLVKMKKSKRHHDRVLSRSTVSSPKIPIEQAKISNIAKGSAPPTSLIDLSNSTNPVSIPVLAQIACPLSAISETSNENDHNSCRTEFLSIPSFTSPVANIFELAVQPEDVSISHNNKLEDSHHQSTAAFQKDMNPRVEVATQARPNSIEIITSAQNRIFGSAVTQCTLLPSHAPGRAVIHLNSFLDSDIYDLTGNSQMQYYDELIRSLEADRGSEISITSKRSTSTTPGPVNDSITDVDLACESTISEFEDCVDVEQTSLGESSEILTMTIDLGFKGDSPLVKDESGDRANQALEMQLSKTVPQLLACVNSSESKDSRTIGEQNSPGHCVVTSSLNTNSDSDDELSDGDSGIYQSDDSVAKSSDSDIGESDFDSDYEDSNTGSLNRFSKLKQHARNPIEISVQTIKGMHRNISRNDNYENNHEISHRVQARIRRHTANINTASTKSQAITESSRLGSRSNTFLYDGKNIQYSHIESEALNATYNNSKLNADMVIPYIPADIDLKPPANSKLNIKLSSPCRPSSRHHRLAPITPTNSINSSGSRHSLFEYGNNSPSMLKNVGHDDANSQNNQLNSRNDLSKTLENDEIDSKRIASPQNTRNLTTILFNDEDLSDSDSYKDDTNTRTDLDPLHENLQPLIAICSKYNSRLPSRWKKNMSSHLSSNSHTDKSSNPLSPELPVIDTCQLQFGATDLDIQSIQLSKIQAHFAASISVLENLNETASTNLNRLKSCEHLTSQLVELVNSDATDAERYESVLETLYRKLGVLEAAKLFVSVHLASFRSLFEEITKISESAFPLAMQNVRILRKAYKLFISAQGKSVRLGRRIKALKTYCASAQLLSPHQNTFSRFDITTANSNKGKSKVVDYNDCIFDELRRLEEELAQTKEKYLLVSAELYDVKTRKDTSQGALAFYACLTDSSAVVAFRTLYQELRNLRSFSNLSEHIDFTTLRDGLKRCVGLAPHLDRFVQKYNSLYTRWLRKRINLFQTWSGADGPTDISSYCPICCVDRRDDEGSDNREVETKKALLLHRVLSVTRRKTASVLGHSVRAPG